jgi:hypothetical protein
MFRSFVPSEPLPIPEEKTPEEKTSDTEEKTPDTEETPEEKTSDTEETHTMSISPGASGAALHAMGQQLPTSPSAVPGGQSAPGMSRTDHLQASGVTGSILFESEEEMYSESDGSDGTTDDESSGDDGSDGTTDDESSEDDVF